MTAPSRAERTLFGGSALSAFGTGLTLPYLLIYLVESIQIPLHVAVLWLAAPAIVGLIGTASIGPAIDRIGPARFAALASSSSALGCGALALSNSSSVWTALGGVVALECGMSMTGTALQAAVGLLVVPDRRSRFFSAQAGWSNALFALGTAASSLAVAEHGVRIAAAMFGVNAVGYIASGAMFAVLARSEQRAATPDDRRTGIRSYVASIGVPLRDPLFLRLVMLTFVISLVIMNQSEYAFPAFAAGSSLQPWVGFGFTVGAIAAALTQILAAPLLKARLNRMYVTVAAMTVAASWVLLWMGTWGGAGFLLGFAALQSMGEALIIAVVPAVVLGAAPESQVGKYMALNSFAFQAGRTAAPLLVGVMAIGAKETIPLWVALGSVMVGVAAMRVLRPARCSTAGDQP
ncbi:MFS transporter [Microbacterium sp. 1.5R]|uniref:MFS transporter n=1 Tax=Microbacterium sp. 1.5R TaxID=1916917 RepID=UPI0016432E76|nr:MFS transporter [Microbacterium sp. 1.5R]